jgi:hypothetical protein
MTFGIVTCGTVIGGAIGVTELGGDVVLGDEGDVVEPLVVVAVVVDVAAVDDAGGALGRCGSPVGSPPTSTDGRSVVSITAGAVVSTADIVVSADEGASTSGLAGAALSSPEVVVFAPALTSAGSEEGRGISGMGSVGGATMAPATSGGPAISTEVDGRGLPMVAIAATAAMTPAPTRKPRGVCTGEASKRFAGDAS